jgi:hypothetical protein
VSAARWTAAMLIAAMLGAPGCGGHKPYAGQLGWQGKPSVFRARNLPHDRVVIARVENTGSKTLHLVAARLVVRDAAGQRLDATAAFTTTFAHGLYGALEQPPGGPPAQELVRLGKVTYLPPGSSAPFYAAWHLKRGSKPPLRIDYGIGSLTIPEAAASAH